MPRRTASDNILRDKGFIFAKNPSFYGYQCGLASMIYKFFDERFLGDTAKSEKNFEPAIFGLGLRS